MKIVPCCAQHLAAAARLLNDYRQFYEQGSDLPGCLRFLQQNLEQGRSQLFLLLGDDGTAVGFTQLYPSQCSISMQPYFYLSDLYIDRAHRRHGYARHLMTWLQEHFKAQGAQRLTLDTATTNLSAHSLYESLGYERDEVYITYHQILDTDSARQTVLVDAVMQDDVGILRRLAGEAGTEVS